MEYNSLCENDESDWRFLRCGDGFRKVLHVTDHQWPKYLTLLDYRNVENRES